MSAIPVRRKSCGPTPCTATTEKQDVDTALNNAAFLCNFDFSGLEELDPALIGGWSLLYSREIPGEIRMNLAGQSAIDDIGTVEPMTFKVLIRGNECQPEELKVEITSENELFLHYVHKVEQTAFPAFSASQHLLVDFVDYPSVLMRMANSCIQMPEQYVGILMLHDDGTADLSFIQNIEYKFVELLRLPLRQSTEETLRQSIQYRHQALRTKLAAMHARLQDVGSILQSRSPTIVDDLLKCVHVLGNACPPILKSSCER